MAGSDRLVIGSDKTSRARRGAVDAATSTSWISSGRPPAVPTAYNFDLTVDVKSTNITT